MTRVPIPEAFYNIPGTPRGIPSEHRDNPLPLSLDRVASLPFRVHAQEPARQQRRTAKDIDTKDYPAGFIDFMTNNPTVWHTVEYFSEKLKKAGFEYLSERDSWDGKLKKGGRYYVRRNGSSLIAFVIPKKYKAGNGVVIIGSHVDALTARLKPTSKKDPVHGHEMLGVAPYAGGLNSTWWDRDLGVGGRVVLKENGKIVQKLVRLDWPIGRIPTLAPHFGSVANGPFNKETQMIPIIGLSSAKSETINVPPCCFAATQPPKLVKAISSELGIKDYTTILNWELELYDTQPATLGGLDKEFIYAGRIDDKLCSWAAVEGLLAALENGADELETISSVGLFDNEEIGSRLRQGAMSNFIPSTFERIVEQFSEGRGTANLLSKMYANSFLISADVTHALNPNFMHAYDTKNSPILGGGLCVSCDSSGHMSTTAVSHALLSLLAEKADAPLQVFHIRNDVRSGGTIGPMTSAATGILGVDVGLAQWSMHSIRATCSTEDLGLGIKVFASAFENWAEVFKNYEGFSH